MSRENKPRDDVTKTRENFTTDNDSEDVKSNLLNDYNNYGNGDKKNDDVIKKKMTGFDDRIRSGVRKIPPPKKLTKG